MSLIKKIFVVLIVSLVIFFIDSDVFAQKYTFEQEIVGPGVVTDHSQITAVTWGVWSIVKLLFQVVAVAVLGIIGIKYMIASADQKADLKKSLYGAIIGVIFVFGAALVVDVFQNFVDDVFGT